MNESSHRSAQAFDDGGRDQRSPGDRSPLQTRAPFLQNWNWQSVISINAGACARGSAQHGFNQETQATCEKSWTSLHPAEITLGEALDHLREFHRSAPFLFYNGNTFSAIGRQLAGALFSDLPPIRTREVVSAAAHYIAGVLDRASMVEIIERMCQSADLVVGTKVRTLRGSTRGSVTRVLPDGRITWRTETGLELTGLPESLEIDSWPT